MNEMIGVGLYGDTKRVSMCVCQDEVSNFSVFFLYYPCIYQRTL